MLETQVSFLVKAVSTLAQAECNPTQKTLKSFYLMRCRELTKGFGLPEKYFSSKVRCPRCFVDWEKGTEVKIQQIKLSKKQRRRIRQYKTNKSNNNYVEERRQLLFSNKIEQMCKFCKNSSIIISPKPAKQEASKVVFSSENRQNKALSVEGNEVTKINNKKNGKKNNNVCTIPKKIQSSTESPEVNVYSKSKDAFSLSNKNNTLKGVVKPEKNVKNNKKKKDKFAGLCQQAVLASAKLKEEKLKQNKLNLFLKPSS
ncbi:unnamed protein product [Diatraea saccharalis]|uniref:Uncharacterized protein n=1 Tax=Diatraea saccharalis TaxID=40085 RepID=A0A9N9RE31_9NEOP|nr:unnamed protein product [Diatraea saccharalis]